MRMGAGAVRDDGRRNHYEVNDQAAVATPVARGVQLGALIAALLPMLTQSL
jgi:hypothetical protein